MREHRLPTRLVLLFLTAFASAAAVISAIPAGNDLSRPAGPGQRIPLPKEEGPVQRDDRAEQVLREAIKAHGGTDAIANRQSIYLKYRITNFDYPDPQVGTVTIWFKRPSKIRQEIAYPGRKETLASDGARAWRDDGSGPTLMGPLYSKMIERGNLELDLPLLYMQGSLKYLSIGKDPNGTMTHKLSWRHQGYARDIMVDVATSRILVIGEFDTPAGAISRMRLLGDYRPVQGVMMPYHQETYRNDQKYTQRELIEAKFNLSLEESLFRFPGPETSPSQDKAGVQQPAPR